MTTQPFDGTRYKLGQREEWDQVADAWLKWWSIFERGGQKVSDRLADLASTQPGQRVLDIATGIGEPAATVAQRVWPQGSVVATDQSTGMLAIAQQRMAGLGLRNVELVEEDAEALDLPEEEFDAIVCRWGLMFLPNLNEALVGVHRSLKAGGKFAASVWSTPDKVPFVSLPMGIVQKMLEPPPPPPPPNAPNLFKLGASGVVESAFEQAGFKNVQSEVLTVEMSYDSPEQYRDFMRDIAAPIRALVSSRSPEVQEAFWEAILEGARSFAGPGGNVKMHGETILVVGSK